MRQLQDIDHELIITVLIVSSDIYTFFFKFFQKILKINYVEGVYEFKLHPVCTEHQHLLTL